MSYARSPRPLCSTTIGTRPKACGSKLLALSIFMSALLCCWLVVFKTIVVFSTMSRLLFLAHQFVKSDGLVGHLGLAQHERNHVVLDRHAFHFLQALRLSVVPANDFFRLLVAGSIFLDQGTNLFRGGLQLFRLDHFGKDQAKGH